MVSYQEFLSRKSQLANMAGFKPLWMPDFLKPFQRALDEWAILKGRAAIFADCGLGKTPMLLVFAENCVRHTNKPAMIFAPLAVSHQIVREAEKFGIEAHVSKDGKPQPNITVANYERLDKFSPDDYCAVVCDEASIVKHWSGATQKAVTRFMSKVQYRLLCTATPAPNDYIEMGTASEALGELTHSDMLATFFRQVSDDEKRARATASDIIHSKRLSWRVLQSFGQWALRSHAFEPFWKWVSSWGRACRKPSDLGPFDDSEFVLPPLNRRDHTVEPKTPPPGFLYNVPAFGLNQERAERRRTLTERTELVAELVKEHDRSVIWCHLNPEGDLLEKMIPNSLQVAGRHDMEYKEDVILWFLGQKCLCNDKRFSAKIASWQKDHLATGSAIINSIVNSDLLTTNGEPQTTAPNDSHTTANTTEKTKTSSKRRRNNGRKSLTVAEQDTQPMLDTARNARKKQGIIIGEIQTPNSSNDCDGLEYPLTNTSAESRTDAKSAENQTATKENTDCMSITAIGQGASADSSARIVIMDSENSETIQGFLKQPQCICGHQSGIRRLISKPKVCGLGLNLQECAHVVTFVDHSYEKFYQCIRRCWRFGQKRPVTLDVIATEGEVNVSRNMERKEKLAAQMVDSVVRFMNDAQSVKANNNKHNTELPQWLCSIK